jgi:hypothetical protein
VLLDELPELVGVLILDLAALVHEGAVPFKELDALGRVGRDVVILVLESKKKMLKTPFFSPFRGAYCQIIVHITI